MKTFISCLLICAFALSANAQNSKYSKEKRQVTIVKKSEYKEGHMYTLKDKYEKYILLYQGVHGNNYKPETVEILMKKGNVYLVFQSERGSAPHLMLQLSNTRDGYGIGIDVPIESAVNCVKDGCDKSCKTTKKCDCCCGGDGACIEKEVKGPSEKVRRTFVTAWEF